MKKIAIYCLLLIFVIQYSFAQGFTFDKTSFDSRELIEKERGDLPISKSLKKYAPISYPQIGGTCVAHSFSNAMTINGI